MHQNYITHKILQRGKYSFFRIFLEEKITLKTCENYELSQEYSKFGSSELQIAAV